VEDGNRKRWTDDLEDEDLAFLKRFVLASGSLKDTAESYQISYPTVRLRLDRLIAKIQILDESTPATRFESILRASCAGGKIDYATMKKLLDAYRAEKEET
jgi:hypothetical protein